MSTAAPRCSRHHVSTARAIASGSFVPKANRSSGSAAPPHSAIRAAITCASPAARASPVTGFRGSPAYGLRRGRRAHACGARRRAEAMTRPVPPPSASATRARTAGAARAEGSCERNHDATSPMPPATMNVTAATSTNGALASSSPRVTRVSANTPTPIANEPQHLCTELTGKAGCDGGPAPDQVQQLGPDEEREGQRDGQPPGPLRREHDHADDRECERQPRPPRTRRDPSQVALHHDRPAVDGERHRPLRGLERTRPHGVRTMVVPAHVVGVVQLVPLRRGRRVVTCRDLRWRVQRPVLEHGRGARVLEDAVRTDAEVRLVLVAAHHDGRARSRW